MTLYERHDKRPKNNSLRGGSGKLYITYLGTYEYKQKNKILIKIKYL
jgi:hypothetical protein